MLCHKFVEKFDPPVYSCPTGKKIVNVYVIWPQKARTQSMECSTVPRGVQACSWLLRNFTWNYCLELNFKIHWGSLGHLPSEYLWFSGQEIETLDPFGKKNSGNLHLIVQFHLLSSVSQPSEGPQQPKSTSAQFSALPILQTWLSLAVSR